MRKLAELALCWAWQVLKKKKSERGVRVTVFKCMARGVRVTVFSAWKEALGLLSLVHGKRR